MKKQCALMMAVVMAVSTTGCAVAPVADRNYSLVDPRGVDPVKYDEDYRECASLANQTDVGERAATSGAAGAVMGALVGALLGVAIGGNGSSAAYGAGVGAAAGASQGAVGGAASGAREQQVALRRCLAGRGYSIIR